MIVAERVGLRGERFDAELVRQFILSALDHDAAQAAVDELVFDHVVADHVPASAVAGSLRPILDEILGAATWDDWQVIANRLIVDARELEAGARVRSSTYGFRRWRALQFARRLGHGASALKLFKLILTASDTTARLGRR
jgi:hypothetical protein